MREDIVGERNGVLAVAPTGMVVQVGTRRSEAPSGERKFTISELACEFGVTLRALRFYERKGLIAPERRGSVRLYSRADRDRLALILTGKRLGFTLMEISRLVAEEEGSGANSLRLSRDQCLEQIALLEEQRRGIEAALAELRRIHAGLSGEIVGTGRIAC